MEAVYIHIPFCVSKCAYCDFASVPLAGSRTGAAQYPAALLGEAELFSRQYSGPRAPLQSIYMGGGTPTALPAAALAEILSHICRLFPPAPGAEITVEANPGTVDRDYFRRLKGAGVNRVSLGGQSFDDHLLRAMGRIHSAENIPAAVTAARQAGIHNLNLDLIYGLPGQTLAGWRCSLEAAAALEVAHISAYGLKVEPDTAWGRMAAAGNLNLPDQDLSAAMLEMAMDFLPGAGYGQYEISNFSYPGFHSRHNTLYWENGDYLGLGVAAASHFGPLRRVNQRKVADYLAQVAAGLLPVAEEERLDPDTALAETVFLGLRLLEGIHLEEFHRRWGVDLEQKYGAELSRLTAQGLVETVAGRLRLTRRGLFLGNDVFMAFLP